MTERQRVEKTYRKIQKKYPHITDKKEIDELAIKLGKRQLLLESLGWLLGAVASVLGFFLLDEDFGETRYVLAVTGIACLFEVFKTLGKCSAVERQYRPVLHVKHEGLLTRERILKDGGKALKKAGGAFELVKLPLYDKADEIDSGVDNAVYHQYNLYFRRSADELPIPCEVKRDQYLNAVIGTEYLAVIIPPVHIAAVYQASNWTVDPELELIEADNWKADPELKRMSELLLHAEGVPAAAADAAAAESEAAYQPDAVQVDREPRKIKKRLPILSMVLMAVSYFCPVILGLPLSIAAMVISIVALAKQRSKLSIAALVVNVILCALLIVSIVVLMGEYL